MKIRWFDCHSAQNHGLARTIPQPPNLASEKKWLPEIQDRGRAFVEGTLMILRRSRFTNFQRIAGLMFFNLEAQEFIDCL